jgi:hypothetical protein
MFRYSKQKISPKLFLLKERYIVMDSRTGSSVVQCQNNLERHKRNKEGLSVE